MAERKIRVLMSKAGLDYHDRGLMLVSKALADAGMEVIYLDAGQMPEQIVETAIQEDVDVVGISSMTAAYREHMGKMTSLLRRAEAKDILVILGGIIQKRDVAELREMGVAQVFGPGSRLAEIVSFVRKNAPVALDR
ncbi:MAG: cobalamin-dependent protein [Candidatus Micrarchaeota archaeon]